MNGLEVSNLKLRCDLDQMKEQLALVEEENSHLRQDLAREKDLYQQLLEGTEEAEAEQLAAPGRCSELENEVSHLKQTLDSTTTCRPC